MKNEDITVKEMQEWMNDTFTLYACRSVSQGNGKTYRLALSISPERIFRVELKGEIKYAGGHEEWAVQLFNDLSKNEVGGCEPTDLNNTGA
jgi:hypothetical protein